MLTYFLVIEVIANNIEPKSITLYDLHPTEGMIVVNNRNNNTHWLLTGIDHFYKSTMELYVDICTIHVNPQHVLYACFCDGINIYRYVYNYASKTMIISFINEKTSYTASQKMHTSKLYDTIALIIPLLLPVIFNAFIFSAILHNIRLKIINQFHHLIFSVNGIEKKFAILFNKLFYRKHFNMFHYF